LTKTKKRPRAATPQQPIEIPLPLLRTTLLRAAKLTHEGLAQKVVEKHGGPLLSRATIGAILGGAFRNAAVIDVFCEITQTDPAKMFPPKEAADAAAS
jgi:hypothetical protein